MALFRYALGRIVGGLLVLALFAAFFNALILSQDHIRQSAAALAGPVPPVVALGAMSIDSPRAEVSVRARIDAAIDVPVPGGPARLFLLADPAAAKGSPARAAIFVSPADLPAFETLLGRSTRSVDQGAPVAELGGVVTVPYWIDRAEAAAAETKRDLAPDLVYLRPFTEGRAAGLAPSVLAYLVPAALLGLIAALLWSEGARRASRSRGLAALSRLQSLDRLAEETAALARELQPGSGRWAEITARREAVRRERVQLDARIAEGVRARPVGWVWLVGMVCGGLVGTVPLRPLGAALSAHLFGFDPATTALGRAVTSLVERAVAMPGDAVAGLVVALFGRQSVDMAAQVRALPFALWAAFLAMLLLVAMRRAGYRREPPDSLR